MEQNESTISLHRQKVRVADYLQLLRPNSNIYRGMPDTYRDGIKSLYQYFKDKKDMVVFPKPHLVLNKPNSAIEWYREASKLQQYMIWNKFIEDAVYME